MNQFNLGTLSFTAESGNISVFNTLLGGGLCCVSSFYYIWDEDGAPKGDIRFYLALFGQALTGIANPFIITVPTKVRIV